MYPVLSFWLPAKPAISQEEIIRAFLDWVSRSQHYDFGTVLVEDVMDGDSYSLQAVDMVAKKAILKLIRCSEAGNRYAAAQLESPDEEHNLLWRAECIFEQRENDKDIPGVFNISLKRDILQPGEPADISTLPKIPYIAKKLLRDGLAAESGDAQKGDHFPHLLVGRDCAGECGEFLKDLKRSLYPVARIETAEEAGGGDFASCAADEVQVTYHPLSGIKKYSYTVELHRENYMDAVRQIVWDIFRMISEVQGAQMTSWEHLWDYASKASAGKTAHLGSRGNYCYMNRAMANCLRQARRQYGMSQKDLAQKVGTTGLIISRLETTRVQKVLRSMLNDIEQALALPKNTIVSLQSEEDEREQSGEDITGVLKEDISAGEADEKVPAKSGYCRFCGTHLYTDSRYCPKCGKKVLH